MLPEMVVHHRVPLAAAGERDWSFSRRSDSLKRQSSRAHRCQPSVEDHIETGQRTAAPTQLASEPEVEPADLEPVPAHTGEQGRVLGPANRASPSVLSSLVRST
jgi:hypothetical protein